VRPPEVTHEQLAEMMVGRQINAESPAPWHARASGLRSAISSYEETGQRVGARVSLDVRAGEIVGIAGVSGNGQRELGEAIACLRPHSRGLSKSTVSSWRARRPRWHGVPASVMCPKRGCATA